MQPHRTFAARWGISGALLVFFALLGIDVRAAVPGAEVVQKMRAATGAMPRSTPAMGDVMPCAYCYAGPAPTVDGFSGESKEPNASGWVAFAKAPAPQARVHCDGRRRPPLPLRIAYCRCSN